MNTKYTFTTIVVADTLRSAFTAKRNELKSTDKELFSAIWDNIDWDKVNGSVEAKQAADAAEKERVKTERANLKAKLKEDLKKATFVTTKPEEAGADPEALADEVPAEEAPTEPEAPAEEVPTEQPAAALRKSKKKSKK